VLDQASKYWAGRDDPRRAALTRVRTLLPFIADIRTKAMSPVQMEMTWMWMAHSLVYWVQDLHRRRLLTRGSRIFRMTSARLHPSSSTTGAVSRSPRPRWSRKPASLALELGHDGILVNAIQAGVTDTPALRKIPGNKALIDEALIATPAAGCTTPQDVAQAVVLLSDPRGAWISGDVIRVDGGEDIGLMKNWPGQEKPRGVRRGPSAPLWRVCPVWPPWPLLVCSCRCRLHATGRGSLPEAVQGGVGCNGGPPTL